MCGTKCSNFFLVRITLFYIPFQLEYGEKHHKKKKFKLVSKLRKGGKSKEKGEKERSEKEYSGGAAPAPSGKTQCMYHPVFHFLFLALFVVEHKLLLGILSSFMHVVPLRKPKDPGFLCRELILYQV